ncbi:hypothetical protein FDV58_16665 [Bradyrhizobium elkanii]|uniref:Uncharacterized protein n=1 Tax=Bradyrhizobium elkanii TaxID=29448 RepID=A0A4U6RZ62_BRAEL|nr:hypothetical protein FDV58_16665 [Bradyrhizobium elkanii]
MATDAAWTIYCATQRDIDESDRRRSLLERHLRGRKVCEDDPEELTGHGIAYLQRLSQLEC